MSKVEMNNPPTPDGSEKINTSRRKLTTAALAGPVVLSALASKQALGAVPYKCTISGQASNNYSPGRDDTSCSANQYAASPTCWRKQGQTGNQSGNATWPNAYPRTMTFNTAFGTSNTTFGNLAMIKLLCANKYGSTGYPAADSSSLKLARAGIANLLNAQTAGAISGHDLYGVTTVEVKQLVASALANIDLIANATSNRVTTLEFLTSLYGGTAANPDSGNDSNCPTSSQTLGAQAICQT